MTKKILLIIGILVIVGVAAFLILGATPPAGEGESRVGFSIRDYLPFGSSDNAGTDEQTPPPTNQEETPNTNLNQPVPRLRKISSEPVAGSIAFNVSTTTFVRFVEKGTGNVYEATSDSVAIQRLTNTTIPKIVRAFWLPDGSGFLAQTLMSESEIIETSFVKLNKNTDATTEVLTPYSTTIGKLPTGIKEISINPAGTKIFYYTLDRWASRWFTSNPDGTGETLVGSHYLTEWLPKWTSLNTVLMQNKGSSGAVGYVYSFNIQSKVFKKVGFGVAGISSNPNADGSLILMSNGGSLPQMFVVDDQNNSASAITASGLAEKCVWTKEGTATVYCAIPNQLSGANYPDDWYKGLVSTKDSIEKIDLNNDIYYAVSHLSQESGEQIDVVDLALSPNQSHLIFRNKIDGYLWMLRLVF